MIYVGLPLSVLGAAVYTLIARLGQPIRVGHRSLGGSSPLCALTSIYKDI